MLFVAEVVDQGQVSGEIWRDGPDLTQKRREQSTANQDTLPPLLVRHSEAIVSVFRKSAARHALHKWAAGFKRTKQR